MKRTEKAAPRDEQARRDAPRDERGSPEARAAYKTFCDITTRWMDNDAYGHVNNVVYYSFLDTAVNQYLIEAGCLKPTSSAVIGLVVETQCSYFRPIAFPDRVTAGIRVARCGRSSVRYEIGLFRNDEQTASAQGHFVHVYVDRASSRPVALPAPLRHALERLLIADAQAARATPT
ncbi:MAG: thioesterase family protein [Variibacter sp.]